MFKNKLNFYTFFNYLFALFILISLSNVFIGYKVLSLPFYVSLLYLKFNPFYVFIIYVISLLINFNILGLYSGLIASFILLITFLIYNKKNTLPKSELIFIYSISILGFIFFDNSLNVIFKLLASSVSLVLTYIFIPASKVIFKKKLNYKITSKEYLCLSIFIILLELGMINVFGFNFLKSINVFIILFAVFTVGSGDSMIISTIISIAPSLFLKNLYPFALFSLMTISAVTFSKSSKILSSFSILALDLIFAFFINEYAVFKYSDLIFMLLPLVVFLFLPPKLTSNINLKIKALNGKYLSKYSINRVRASISNRLYEVSNVFYEMEKSFIKLKDLVSTDEELIARMVDEVNISVCENCPQYAKCKSKNDLIRYELNKIISVGIAKNRVSLVDLTKTFTENCGYVNGIIYEINSLITKYREKVKESEDLYNGKELIQMQSQGVATVLKSMAFDFSKTLEYSNETEKMIVDALKKRGVIFNEITCFTSDDDIEINVIIKNEYVKNGRLINAVNEALKSTFTIVLKTSVSKNLSAVTIKKAPFLDAAFGLAQATKNGSTSSGDTYSLTKIDEGKFLVALSDGMGSGLKAENTSSTAISLIESFYKAGLDNKLVLNMVNKVLALNTDDNFSAMDILTVNLFNLNCDFIKIGAPYSFILTDDSIKIIEGSSLPLGILDDMTPTGCSTILTEGATVIMVTDGVSDAFSSSTDFIEFLRTLDNKNPQLIADNILKRALNIEKDTPKDDMSVLAIRIFKKVS